MQFTSEATFTNHKSVHLHSTGAVDNVVMKSRTSTLTSEGQNYWSPLY
jgi:hypothetical protein